jgi:hypothetical protein
VRRAGRERGRTRGRGQRGAACSMWRRAGLAWLLVIFQVASWALLEGSGRGQRAASSDQGPRQAPRLRGDRQERARVATGAYWQGAAVQPSSVVWEPAPGACRWGGRWA